MMFFSVVKWVVECVHRCVPIFVCACFCLLQWLHKLVHSRMEKKSLREMRVLVCQVILVSFFFFFFFFYNGSTSWCTHTWRRKAGKSKKGGRRKWNGLRCRETGHELRVPMCANFLKFFFYNGSTNCCAHTWRRKAGKSKKGGRRKWNGLQRRETGHELRVLMCSSFCCFPFFFFYNGPHTGALAHGEKKQGRGEHESERREEKTE